LVGLEFDHKEYNFTDSSPETVEQVRHRVTENIGQLRIGYKFDTPITLTVDTSRPAIH